MKHKNRLPPFVPLLVGTLDLPAWLAMSRDAKVLYIALRRRVPGGRNRAFISSRHAMKELHASSRNVAAWFKELEHYGFIVLAAPGGLGVEGKGKAPHWRLTELGQTSKASAGGLFEEPTKDFLKWNGVKFVPPRDARTPGAYGCKKQNPVTDGGYTPQPTGVAPLQPTGVAPKRQSVTDGGYIGAKAKRHRRGLHN